MPVRMPNRFDIVYAHGIDDKIKEDCIGYVMDIREDERKSQKVVNGSGLPAFTLRQYCIKFLNHEEKFFEEEIVFNNITNLKWRCVEPTIPPNLDKPRYEIGDLIYNKNNKKIALIISMVDTKTGHKDFQTKSHSQFWYKVQGPGQRWEPLSETFIEHGIENNFIEIHRRKPNTVESVPDTIDTPNQEC